MKTKLVLILCCALLQLSSQEIVQLKFSKPFAVLKFLETTKGTHGTSQTFKQQIDTCKVLQSESFKELINTYQSLNLDYTYSKQFYPQKRKHTTSTWDLLCIAAISANSKEAFFEKIIGILPNDDYLKLKRVMTNAEPFYDTFIFTSNQPAIDAKLKELKVYTPKLNELFEKFKFFYGSSWDKSMPFNLTIYPIYGNRGQTTATPHANSLEMGFLLDDKDIIDMASVGVHEMCHVLFEEQPLSLQQKIDSAFTKKPDPNAKLAYRYIDEALATALGNGYAYNYLSANRDTSEWYHDLYINLYAKALYPLVTEYIEGHKQMDEAFVLEAITVFKKTFPNSLYDFDAALMNSDAYFEDDETKVVDNMINTLHAAFRIHMSNTYIPINDKAALENIHASELAQVFVIHKNQIQNLNLLKTLFRNLKKLPKEKNMLISFLDDTNRIVIIIVAENQLKAIEGITLLKAKSKIDPKHLWVKF